MLQTIREKLTGWFAVFILGAIALTLVVTFGNIDTGFTPGSTAASINGEDVTLQEFRQIYQRQKQQWESNFRTQIPDVIAQQMAESVIQSLIRNKVVAQHVQDQTYRVNDDRVVEEITGIEAFEVGGKFSQPAYEQLLRSQGMSTERFEYEQRQSMQISQFLEGLGYTAFYTPLEFRRYIELDGESRDLEYLILPVANWDNKVVLEEADLQAYYDANPAQFQTQESVKLAFVEVNFDAVVAEISVGEAEALTYYDNNQEEFRGPDERRASHVLIAFGDDEQAAEALAKDIASRLAAGESFADLAAEFSADTGTAANGGDLGWFGVGDSPAPEFEEALFALQQGQISAPVRTDFGFHVILQNGMRAGDAQDFSEIQTELVSRLREDAALENYGDLLDELDELALESLDGLESVAEAMGLELGSIENFTRSGGDPLGYSPALVDTVFSLEVLEDGENSPVLEVEEGRAVVVQVVEHRMPELIAFAEVRESIETQMRADAAIMLAGIAGNDLVEALNDGADADTRGQALALTWQRPDQVQRGNADIPADLSAAVFSAPKPQNISGPGYQGLMLASGDFAAYRIRAVNPGRPDTYSTQDRDARKQQLANRLGGGQATAVVEALVETAKVRVTPNLISTDSGVL
jgi:peptidyl-prolyl cis-trans isomerase D